jgi:hypothetical protein
VLQSSEDAEEEVTSEGIGDETRNDSHHCPASIIGLCVLLRRFKTLTVVGFYYHLGFFGEQILLTKFVRRYSHLLNVVNLYILYSKKGTLSRVPL